MRLIFVSLYLLFSTTVCLGQNFIQDMQKIRDSYDNNYVSMQVNYQLFNSEKDIKPAQTQGIWMESHGNRLHYKGQGQDVTYTDKNLLIVSVEDREITLDTVMENFNQPGNEFLPVDTISSHMKNISYQDLGNGLVKYTLIPKDNQEFSRMSYTINTNTWLLEKIELHAGTQMGGGKVIIGYSKIIKQKEPPTGVFTFKPFINEKPSGGYQLMPAYSGYKFYHRNNYKK